jgi:hypothetical protein
VAVSKLKITQQRNSFEKIGPFCCISPLHNVMREIARIQGFPNKKDPPRCHGESISLTVIAFPGCTVQAL